MDEKQPEEKEETLPGIKDEEEIMEINTCDVQNVILSHEEADKPSEKTDPETKTGEAVTDFSALPENSLWRKEIEVDSSEDTDSSSSSSMSSPCVSGIVDDEDDEGFSQPAPIKTCNEVLLDELPPVEEMSVSLPEGAVLQPVGTISSIIQQLVIIQSLKDMPPLTDDSFIFNADRLAVGKVFEVFGPVSSPLYIIRFNTEEEIKSKGLTVGLTVFCAPAIKEYTSFVITQHLQLLKGSDASWKNDQEPPEEALDYSDDEQEQQAKRKRKHNSQKQREGNHAANPGATTHNVLQHQQPDVRARHTRFRQHSLTHEQPPVQQAHPPPEYPQIPPVYLPPPCPYPPPPLPPPQPPHAAPPMYPPYPPPPLPSFFSPPPSSSPVTSFYSPPPSSPFWPYSTLPPPPPPPPPPPQ
ncbi:H/ACA ribonucleoprotein complex non-core subunit NAF1 isoform X2 [Thalassophryne amazonica]|uniref:H/ACA ribonucleoprotein complex non-core subunit NAF1 isoform X2 n=1 Tax=Thalassophryne amazonica TaxID=390379 RepID=UPI00147172DD|nr:H/ACA ribonucleoprotein complex non-core subunit NAF1 isoform X2 [Thalassophryne amazonica]